MTTERPKILIVDDSFANLQVLNVILQSEYDVFFAESGTRALEVAQTVAPGLILLDVMMPDMDGYQTCERLKADPATRDIPVIFVTALSEAEDESKGFAVGAVDYVAKPLRVETIKARVRTHLDLRRHQTDLERLIEERSSALIEAYERLKIVEKTKSDLLSSVSHELRTPLTSIIGFVQMASKKLEVDIAPVIRASGDEDALESLGRAEDNLAVALEESRRLSQLVNNVMDLLNLVSDAVDIIPEPISISLLVEDAVRLVERDFLRKGVRLDVSLPDKLPLVNGDRERLALALSHLLSNGAKFAKRGVVRLWAGENKDGAFITVADDGPGIAPEHHEIVFE